MYCFTTFRRLGDEPNETFRVDEDDYQVRAQAIRVLSNISINEYADAIAACLEQDHRDVRIAALEAMSTLSPASLANYSAAIVHHLKNPPSSRNTVIFVSRALTRCQLGPASLERRRRREISTTKTMILDFPRYRPYRS